MPRPKSKQELLKESEAKFEKMWIVIDSIPEEILSLEFDFSKDTKKKEAHWQRDKNLRDVLVHLHEWHALLINWLQAIKNQEEKSFLPSPYNWRTYGQLNLEFWQKHQCTTHEMAQQLVQRSHQEVMNLLKTFSNTELFSKGIFKQTGSTTLGSYCVSSTSSHYEWAIKKLKAHIRQRRVNAKC